MAEASANDSIREDLPVSGVSTQIPATLNENGLVENDTESEGNLILNRFQKLTRPRQIQLIITLAAVISMIVAVFLWSSEPNYQLLYGKLSDEAAGDIIPILKQEGIKYTLDSETGQLKVPAVNLHATRILLASQGLPKSDSTGFELLDEQVGFGSSQFIEKVRYHRALEGELARSITGLDVVDFSRVHLAIPKQSVFVRDKKSPSAAVMVSLKFGRNLDEGQISAIAHIVASSVPNMQPEKVTVVDQKGKLLSKKELSGNMAMSNAQFDYRRKLEEYYIERIERILIPIVGFDGVRAQVDTDIDFTVIERTQESFNPDLPALRSEHTMSEESKGGDLGGVPGALTNQPPGVATAPEKLPGAGDKRTSGPSRKSSQATFNYELDKTVSHSTQAPGQLRRLSVAVVIDDKTSFDDEANLVQMPHAPEDLERITSLIKEAVGFSEARGDSINVINASFKNSQVVPKKPLLPIWERTWFIDIAKQIIGILLILLFIVIALRPIIRELTFKEEIEEEVEEEVKEEEEIQENLSETGGLSQSQWDELGISYEEYEQMLATLKELAADDPRIVAQVIKTWVALDEEGM